ncbi:tyrosyl-DNA phosphodiesterase-domain-containing protein [Chaetomium fimeti]|uniref:Tyrosyl-DNA phosphodiesterase-domain-containing protein n=1 Tax=Chaetomium fimeti TaxID=1854472 RepID=A0AAE0HE69_9PEZI|nr:tyrosyl-DNA phosphodiesterase-domain-containing protein [Chaetomium fimeti]
MSEHQEPVTMHLPQRPSGFFKQKNTWFLSAVRSFKATMDRSNKRPAPDGDCDEPTGKNTPVSLTHPVSPPLKRRQLAPSPKGKKDTVPPSTSTRVFKSPFQLTKIRDLPPEMNKDTVTLKDILGDPLISECWEFNYLHDIDFLMSAFDQDVRHLVKVHVVHGFWKKEDPSRLKLQEAASRFPNVTLHNAFLPEMFGTHHSKMMILLRHDETAQIVIHTANLIVRDWANMTQAAWRSPSLPLMEPPQQDASQEEAKIGSGAKFKMDLLNYLRAYDTRRTTCKPIIEQLSKYDFSAIRGSLIASVPGRHRLDDPSPTRWGWAAMAQALQAVPVSPTKPEIAIQISSIATLGPTDTWLKNTLFRSLSGGKNTTTATAAAAATTPQPPSFKVVFPTPDEIRKSLDGYGSGGSIHTKTQSAQQAKQLTYLKPIFHHWANDSANGTQLVDTTTIHEAGRKRAAPHIKTYIRYGSNSNSNSNSNSSNSSSNDAPVPAAPPSVDWALVTSANLSKQAWGDAVSPQGEVRIASYEIGVLVWPGLYAEGATMTPTFLTDSLGDGEGEVVQEGKAAVVALRVPYNLPLQAYGVGEVPWVATARHLEPDWMGQVWQHG